MKEKILTDNAGEKLTAKWDGTRFALTQEKRDGWYEVKISNIVILNPKEMLDLVEFTKEAREEDEQGEG